MGWWSPTILGGDYPADTAYDIAERFGGYTREWGSWDAYPETLRAKLEATAEFELVNFINSSYEAPIAAQVVALVHMACGARLSPVLRQLAVRACQGEDTSSWRSPSERQHHLAHFVCMINQYDDQTPARPPEIGVFAAVAQHITTGRSGLLNDNC